MVTMWLHEERTWNSLYLTIQANHNIIIVIYIFQTVHFLAVKFRRGNEENMSILLIPQSQKIWQKFWSNRSPLTVSKLPKHVFKELFVFWFEKLALNVSLSTNKKPLPFLINYAKTIMTTWLNHSGNNNVFAQLIYTQLHVINL